MQITDANTAREFVKSWRSPSANPLQARRQIEGALRDQRYILGIKRTYPTKYVLGDTLAAIAVLERAVT
jgi:hypothetical protein